MNKRCIVFDCQNRESQGRFIGDLCVPCHDALTTQPKAGRQYSQVWRNSLQTARMFDRDREEHVMNMNLKKAFDIVDILNNDKDDNWSYCAEVDAVNKTAKISVYDENDVKLGYLGEFDIIKTEVVA